MQTLDKEELKKRLTPEQYHVTQEKGTERAFTGKYAETKDDGMYHCVVCGAPLFSSETKFDSGTGWPSFYDPVGKGAVGERPDNSLLRKRTEVICNNCGAHLGHVFNDGPKEMPDKKGGTKTCTGLRYCLNSAALNFEPKPGGSGE